jgi:hypothetical protein
MLRDLRPFGCALATLAVTACAAASPLGSPYQEEHVSLNGVGNGRYDILLTHDRSLSSDTVGVATPQAWKGLVRTYMSFGAPLEGVDGQHYMIATEPFRVHGTFAGESMSKWIDCGQSIMGDRASTYEVTLRLGTLLDTTDVAHPVARTAMIATAVTPGSSTAPIECGSRGLLERRIAALALSNSK